MKKYKLFLLFALFFSYVCPIYAQEISNNGRLYTQETTLGSAPQGFKHKLKGDILFQGGIYRNGSSDYNIEVPSDMSFISKGNKNAGVLSNTTIAYNIEGRLNEHFIYGANINIDTLLRNNKSNQSFLYFITDAGTMEIGGAQTVYNTLKISSYANAWSDWVILDPLSKKGANASKLAYNGSLVTFLDKKSRDITQTEYPAKITYYTNPIGNFVFGISYVPSTFRNAGDDFRKITLTPIPSTESNNANKLGIKNGVMVGGKYSKKFDSHTINVSSFFEYGEPIITNINGIKQDTGEISKLNAIYLGAEYNAKSISLSVLYSNFFQSFTLPSDDMRDTYFIEMGAKKQIFDNTYLSATYTYSYMLGNQLDAITGKIERRFLDNMTTSVELSHVATSAYRATSDQVENNSSYILILSNKITF